MSLYEADGDWLFADLEHDETVWVGGEWTGDQVVRFALPWSRALSFVVWRLLDGGFVRPVDLLMLGATSAAPYPFGEQPSDVVGG